MITPNYFVKIKRRNSKNTKIFISSYVRETFTDLDTGFRKEREPK